MPRAETYIYVGCYTNRSPVGIHTFRVAGPELRLDSIHRLEGVPHLSFLAPHPNGTVLYAVSETSAADGGGQVVAFAIGADGSLTESARTPSHGDHPCHLSVDPGGRHLHVANYSSGTMAVVALEPDGRPGELRAVLALEGSGPTVRQTGPHAHCVVPDPEGRWLYTADLGSDRIVQSRGGRRVREYVTSPGTGPRLLRFHPSRPLLFAVGELDNSLLMLTHDRASGALSHVATVSTLPDGWTGDSLAADLHVHPSGRFVYVSNRGHDSIVTFALDERSITPVGWVPAGGRTPRGFGLTSAGDAMVVAHQDDDSLGVFRVDPRDGTATAVGNRNRIGEPVCVTFVRALR